MPSFGAVTVQQPAAMAALLQLGAALTLVGGAIGLKGSHAAAPRAGSAPASPRIDPYAVSWAVQGAQSFVCAGCDSAPFQPGGSADVSKFGLLGPNRTYVASWGSIFPTRFRSTAAGGEQISESDLVAAVSSTSKPCADCNMAVETYQA